MSGNPVKSAVQKFGLPRIIIVGFFIFLVIAAGGFQMNLMQLLSDCVHRWGMSGILTLAMVSAAQCGIGLNFGISMGAVGGPLGGLIMIEFDVVRIPALVAVSPVFGMWMSALIAIVIGVIPATGTGYLYGLLLNQVKGSEMTVATYVGFSITAFMNMLWMLLPSQNGELRWPNVGKGLRNTISLSTSFSGVMNDTLSLKIGKFTVSTGLLLFMFSICLLVWLFTKSKTGTAMSVASSNPMLTEVAGIGVNRMRLVGTIPPAALAVVDITVYVQELRFMQLCNGLIMMGFNSVAAVSTGSASSKRVRISNISTGTFLFQGILAPGLSVAGQFIPEGNLSEVMYLIISNGITIYTLAQTKEGDRRE